MSIQHGAVDVGGRDEHTYTTKQKCQVNNISGTPELDINYSMGGWGRATSGNFEPVKVYNWYENKLKIKVWLYLAVRKIINNVVDKI